MAQGDVAVFDQFNMTTGDLTITWGAPFATLDQA